MKAKHTVGILAAFLSISSLPLMAEEVPADEGNGVQALVEEAQRMARNWAERLRERKDEDSRPSTYMGVVIEPVPDVLRDYIDLPKGVGLLFSHIAPESPAARAGLEDNDIIVTFDGQLIVNYSQLATLIDLRGPGEPIPMTILRKGEEMELTVTLEKRVAGAGRQSSAPRAPAVPGLPDLPALPDPLTGEEVGAFMERIEEWIPGSVSVHIDENQQVHVDLGELRENLHDLRAKLKGMNAPEAVPEIRREYGDLGARTTIVHVQDRNVNYSSDQGKLVLTSSEAGRQAMVWDASGELIYQGPLPEQYEGTLPETAVELIEAYEQSRRKLKLEDHAESLEIKLKDTGGDPLTRLPHPEISLTLGIGQAHTARQAHEWTRFPDRYPPVGC
jgi:membrane-associated protease RseP (regulator of RpoE activity)